MDPYVQYLQEIAGGMQRFVQPDIDLAMRVLGLPSEIIRQNAEGPLTKALGPTGGLTMADALSQVLGPMMAIPEGAGFVEPIAPPQRRGTQMLPGVHRAPLWDIPEGSHAPRYDSPSRMTGPLPSVASEPRFHGTMPSIREMKSAFPKPSAIAAMRDPDRILDTSVSAYGNLYGPGFYTTDNFHVASGYGGNQSNVYRVYGIGNPKFLQGREPIPLGMRNALQKNLQNLINNDALRSGWDVQLPSQMTPEQFYTDLRWNYHSPDRAVREFVKTAEDYGYAGIEHEGGTRVGDRLHNVKIYWRPERDVRIRSKNPEKPPPVMAK